MPIKYIIIGIVVLVITTTVGGTIYAVKSHIEGLGETITEQQEQIAGLEIDKTKLEVSNASLDEALSRKIEEAKQIQEEITTLRKVDAESQERMIEITRKLRDKEEVERREKARAKKAGLILRLMDAQAKCWVENFDRKNGKCVRGRWVKEGGRLVPKGGSGNDATTGGTN